VSVLDPPWKVGVAPTTAPEAEATVMLCSSGDMFVKAIETLPAFALSELDVYFSWPEGSAASVSEDCPEPLVPLAGALAALEVVGACAALDGAELAGGVEAEEELPLEELPQPATASRAMSSVGVPSLDSGRGFA
jgi:hypothetical protein